MRELFCTDSLAGFSLRAEAAFSLGELACDNRSIFYRACPKFVTRFASKINPEVCRQMARVSLELKNCDNSDLLRKTLARLKRCSKPVKNRKNPFFNLFVQIAERIRTVVDKGYFPHDSSHSEDEASARKMAGFQIFFLVS